MPTKFHDMPMLSSNAVADYRAGKSIGYDDPVTVVASGRATCRACGERIAKGEPAIRVAHDFHGSGSFTLTTVYLHAGACPPEG